MVVVDLSGVKEFGGGSTTETGGKGTGSVRSDRGRDCNYRPPPDRSVREKLPHTAPTLDLDESRRMGIKSPRI